MSIEHDREVATIIALDASAGVVALQQTLRSGQNGDCYGSVLFGVYPITDLGEDTATGQLQGELGPAYHQHEVTQRHLPIPFDRRLGRANRKVWRIFNALTASNIIEVEFTEGDLRPVPSDTASIPSPKASLEGTGTPRPYKSPRRR